MSAKDIVGEDFWKQVAGSLQGDALSWWKKYRVEIADTAREEAKGVFAALKAGRSVDAKHTVAMRWIRDDRESWRAYRNNTTKELIGIAARRAALMKALEALGEAAAKTIGSVALGALGL